MIKLETIYSQYCARLVPIGIRPASMETYCKTVYEEQEHFVFSGFKFGQNLSTNNGKLTKKVTKRVK